MLTRLQLANGYVAGTLSKEEIAAAEANPPVMKQIETLTKPKVKQTTKRRKTKDVRFKTS